MAAAEFLRGLPEVTANELHTDNLCEICLRQYGAAESAEESPEVAVRLPCGHVIGSQCIATWVSSANKGKNTCPYCRHIFFNPSGNTRGEALLEYITRNGHLAQILDENTRRRLVATIRDSYAVSGLQQRRDNLRPRGVNAQGASPAMSFEEYTQNLPPRPSMPSASAIPSLPSMPLMPANPSIAQRPSVYQPIRSSPESNVHSYGTPRASDLPGTRGHFRSSTATSRPFPPTWMPPGPPHTSLRPIDSTSGYTPRPNDLPASRDHFGNSTATFGPPRPTWMPPSPPHASLRPVGSTSGYVDSASANRVGDTSRATLPAFNPSYSTWMPQSPPPLPGAPGESANGGYGGYWGALGANRAEYVSRRTMGRGTPSSGTSGRGASSTATQQGNMSGPTFSRYA